MTIARTIAGINKAEGDGTAHGQTKSSGALRRVLPTTVPSYSNFVAGYARRLCATEVQ